MILTIGNFWWLIVLAITAVLSIWYWSIRAQHRVVERISRDDPKRFNFKFKVDDPHRKRR